MPRAASSLRRVIAPTSRPRSTSCCFPWLRIMPRRRFRTHGSSTSGRELAEAQRLTHTGSWAADIATRELTHSSEENSRLFGFDPQSDRPSTDEFRQRIHPDDRGRVRDIVDKAARERMDFEVDYRVVLPDGTVKCIHAVSHPVFSASGGLVQFVGTVMDVTEARQAEEERERLLGRERAARAGAGAAPPRF